MGVATGPSEAETFGIEFLRALAARGQRGLKPVVADDHKGLRAAARRVSNAIHRPCRVHRIRNALAHAPAKQRTAIVEVSLAQFDSTMVNLCLNASHAMPEGGLLRIATARVPLHGHETLRDGDYVEIAVEDTGVGIPADIRKGLFAPFASTKGRDGSGMGLFQARRFTEDAGGVITLSSMVGKGTRVMILLPLDKDRGRGGLPA